MAVLKQTSPTAVPCSARALALDDGAIGEHEQRRRRLLRPGPHRPRASIRGRTGQGFGIVVHRLSLLPPGSGGQGSSRVRGLQHQGRRPSAPSNETGLLEHGFSHGQCSRQNFSCENNSLAAQNCLLDWPPRLGWKLLPRFHRSMSMRETINAALKAATKAQDKRRMSTLRLISAAIKDRDIAARTSGKGEATRRRTARAARQDDQAARGVGEDLRRRRPR